VEERECEVAERNCELGENKFELKIKQWIGE
jgi:hypothetical protein